MMIWRSVGVMAIPLVLAGCAAKNDANVFALSPAHAYEKLMAADLKGFRYKRQCGILIHIKPEGEPGQSIKWSVYSSGQLMLWFTANLASHPSGGTQVLLVVSKDPDGTEAYSGKNFYPRPAIMQPLRPAIAELLQSTLEGRPFNNELLGRPDEICNVQRGGLERGRPFAVDDLPNMDAQTSARVRDENDQQANQDNEDGSYDDE